MFQINAHAIPNKSSEDYGKFAGAYVAIYINYADIDGAFALAEYYLTQNDWEIKELEEEYLIIDNEKEVEEDQLHLYREALKDGYALQFNCYEVEGDNN